jgi:tripartite-type tricarboxylate transporter receptor subunit TctC
MTGGMRMFRDCLKCALVLSIIVVLGSAARVAFGAYPEKPVKILMASEAGSADDTEARAMATFLQQYLGVSVTIENQPAASGKIVLEKFQKTTPDGYTLMVNGLPMVIVKEYLEKVGFRTRDFTPIFAWSVSCNVVVVHVDSWKSFDEFLAAAREKTLAGGISALGGISHLCSLAVAKELGIKANWVPFDGSNASLTNLAGKHIDFSIVNSGSAFSLIKAGKLRPLLILSDVRDPFCPDTPTPKELGLKIPTIVSVRGMQAPPKTPPAVVKVLEEACAKAIKEPAFLEFASKRQITLKPYSAQEYGEWIINEAYPTVEKYQGLLKENK